MPKPRILTKRELRLIELYIYWDFRMSPIEFYSKWAVNYEQIALICSRSDSTVRSWFRSGRNQRYPNRSDLQNLALMDFLLEHFEEIPSDILHRLRLVNSEE
jgi:hypothetical protein